MNWKVAIALVIIACMVIPEESYGIRRRRRRSSSGRRRSHRRTGSNSYHNTANHFVRREISGHSQGCCCMNQPANMFCHVNQRYHDGDLEELGRLHDEDKEAYDEEMRELADDLSDKFTPTEIENNLETLEKILVQAKKIKDSSQESDDTELMDLLGDDEDEDADFVLRKVDDKSDSPDQILTKILCKLFRE
ncbi:uncharacterized protein LOC143452975 [Clavelina lepadiformis]|uniref:uncharacterized protein LOC143452975 n=1 Tax=Clavelina lepadiformis TaxID=159417 RepID=UPI004042812A